MRQLLAHLVTNELHHRVVGECTSVAEGLAVCLATQPDLAIVDWTLPDGRGFDVVRGLAGKLPGTRWLGISANGHGNLVREAALLGVHGFVSKRADLKTLRAAVTAVLAGREYYCPESAKLLSPSAHGAGSDGPLDLTQREREILQAYASGENSKRIAERLGLSVKTVGNHLSKLKQKLGISDSLGLVRYAVRRGYIDPP